MNFLKKVLAQSGTDTLATPTFPWNRGTFGSITPTPTTNTNKIVLNSDKAVYTIGQKILVSINLTTNTNLVKDYTVTITYNPSILQVVDKDSTKTGTQIDFQDTGFDASINTVNSQAGTIQLYALVKNNTPVSINRKVAEIEFTAKTAGQVTLDIAKSTDQTFIKNSNGVNILNESVPLIISVTGTTQTPTGGIPRPTILPDGGFIDDYPIITGTIGMLIIIAGIYLGVKYKKPK